MMKAIVHNQYGPPEVLEIREVEKPTIDADQILVRVRAVSVNPAEWYAMVGLPLGRIGAGWLRPKDPRLGADYAGVVEAVGANVTEFKPGDAVFGGRSGAFAEYLAARADRAVVHKPATISFEEAAAVPIAGLTALQGLRDVGQIQPGQKVLINGASGGVGTYAVQLAKHFGAEVTGVCSPRNVDLVRSLGAHRVIDYTREDFTHAGGRYDLFFDIAGSRSFGECRRVLAPKATHVIVGGPKTNRLIGPLAHIIRVRVGALGASQAVKFFIAKFNKPDLQFMADLLAAGQVKSVIDRCYPMSQIREAMGYLGEGHARGKIVVTM